MSYKISGQLVQILCCVVCMIATCCTCVTTCSWWIWLLSMRCYATMNLWSCFTISSLTGWSHREIFLYFSNSSYAPPPIHSIILHSCSKHRPPPPQLYTLHFLKPLNKTIFPILVVLSYFCYVSRMEVRMKQSPPSSAFSQWSDWCRCWQRKTKILRN